MILEALRPSCQASWFRSPARSEYRLLAQCHRTSSSRQPTLMALSHQLLLSPLDVVGIGIGPPGEFSLLAVRTSTPVSVTSNVCSVSSSAWDHRHQTLLARTELGSPFAINRHIGPVVRPIHLLRLPNSKDGLYRERHPRFADTWNLALAVVGDPGRGMEMLVYPVASPSRYNFAASGLGVLLDDGTEVPYRRAGLDDRNGLVQALPGRLYHSDRVRVRLGSVANVVGFV